MLVTHVSKLHLGTAVVLHVSTALLHIFLVQSNGMNVALVNGRVCLPGFTRLLVHPRVRWPLLCVADPYMAGW